MNGVIPLWKPKGMTSHDCVMKLRKLLKIKRIGHTGTLDPEVEGVLPICIGKATKLVTILQNEAKEYVAELSLGKQTVTEDQTGDVVLTEKVSPNLTIEQCEQLLHTFIGEIEQVPPMYSAIRVDGKRLYEYAREGLTVERPKRKVTIHSIELLSNELLWIDEFDVRFKIKVNCSTGTYIRTLCVDIGKKLGYPAHMAKLERTSAGSFTKEDTVTFTQIEQAIIENNLSTVIMPINEALRNIPTLTISDEDFFKYKHGQVLDLPVQYSNEVYLKISTNDNQVIALYEKHPTKQNKMKPFTVFI